MSKNHPASIGGGKKNLHLEHVGQVYLEVVPRQQDHEAALPRQESLLYVRVAAGVVPPPTCTTNNL